MTGTYQSPLWPCPECGGTERYTKDRKCVNCGIVHGPKRRADAAETEPDDAFRATAETDPYCGKDSPDVYVKPYRPEIRKEWPLHTDFRPDNLQVRD